MLDPNPCVSFETASEQPAQLHPCCALFPALGGEQLSELRQDILENGIREAIVFLDGQILDGRNRYTCAKELGLSYPRREFGSHPSDGPDPLAFVVSANLLRRHLSEGQRATIAAKIANQKREDTLAQNRSANLPNGLRTTTAQAATLLNVSPRLVTSARKVEAQGTPELRAAVEGGAISVSAAAELAELPPEEQLSTIAEGPCTAAALRAKRRPEPSVSTGMLEKREKAALRSRLGALTFPALIEEAVQLHFELSKAQTTIRELKSRRAVPCINKESAS